MKKLRKYGRKIKEILQDDHTTAYYYSDEKIERPKPEPQQSWDELLESEEYKNASWHEKLILKIKHILRDNHGEFNVPEHVIREIAQSLIPDLIEFYQSEKGQEEFKKYLEEKNKKVDRVHGWKTEYRLKKNNRYAKIKGIWLQYLFSITFD